MTDARSGHDLAATVAIIKTVKEQTVRRQGVGADLAPMLELRRHGVLSALAVIDGDRDRVLALLHALPAHTDVDRVVFVADAYTWTPDGEPPDHGLEPDELAHRFAAGDPSVTECLQLVAIDRDGTEPASIQIGYTYDRRRVVWADPEPMDIAGGDMIDAIREGFADQATRSRPPVGVTWLADYLGCLLVEPRLIRPPRNEPCPCGSGTKAKHCCWS